MKKHQPLYVDHHLWSEEVNAEKGGGKKEHFTGNNAHYQLLAMVLWIIADAKKIGLLLHCSI